MTLTLKPNTLYRTRDGRRIEVVAVNPECKLSHQAAVGWMDGNLYCWDINGKYLTADSGCDLIAEWREPERHKLFLMRSNGVVYFATNPTPGEILGSAWLIEGQFATEGEGV
jgi:hypothetical protein